MAGGLFQGDIHGFIWGGGHDSLVGEPVYYGAGFLAGNSCPQGPHVKPTKGHRFFN
ncbi:hypothetical protein J8TS2_43140 [Lederbergia ruris]|uniref:Uncharacterized protein n=1 Tax=Lederbergia ruris TaxID=217495 RepID=A0ABQ4KPY5_9BACI|nr:hypothetical protein J8TS2_43140 [Lederbergia ruris]